MIWDRLTAERPNKLIGAGWKLEPAQDRAMLRRIDEIAVREHRKVKGDEGWLPSYREQLAKMLLAKLNEQSKATANPTPSTLADPSLAQKPHAQPKTVAWRTFTPAKLQELRATNTPVLVYCSAKWDATCSILDQTLFANQHVIAAIEERAYVPLLADCTLEPSGELKVFLKEVAGWGGNATLVVFRGPEKEKPMVLQVNRERKTITVDELLNAMKKSPGKSEAEKKMSPDQR